MLEKLRESIKKRLNEKGVSLIMMFDREGRILWHSGRKVIIITEYSYKKRRVNK